MATRRCKRGRRKGTKSCRRKPGPKKSGRRRSKRRSKRRSSRRCKRGRRKGKKSCRRKPGPKKGSRKKRRKSKKSKSLTYNPFFPSGQTNSPPPVSDFQRARDIASRVTGRRSNL